MLVYETSRNLTSPSEAWSTMPHRSEEAAAFFAAAYAAIQEIPRGKVTSYAHIARLIGRRKYTVSAISMIHRTNVVCFRL